MDDHRYLEMKVGAFLLAGILLLGGLIIYMSAVGDFFQSTFRITAEFDNANGIIKGAQVWYRGSVVGKVAAKPQIKAGGEYVVVPINIFSDVKVSKDMGEPGKSGYQPGARFEIGSTGLLGDRYVDIVPPRKDTGVYLSQGDTVKGGQKAGFDSIAADLKPTLENIARIAARIEQKLITDEFTDDVHTTMTNVKEITEKMNKLVGEAEQGKGVLGALLKDDKIANDLRHTMREFKTLSTNLRKKGVLFYSDLSTEGKKDGKSSKSSIKNWRMKR